jgi:hypothetical protein
MTTVNIPEEIYFFYYQKALEEDPKLAGDKKMARCRELMFEQLKKGMVRG